MASHRWAAILITGISLHWIPFHSHIYRYTIMRPSSYSHVVLPDSQHHRVDYFFPPYGDSVTNVNVYCDGDQANAAVYLRSIGAHNVWRDGSIRIMGQQWPLIHASFRGMSESWTEEQVSMRINGRVWHLTMSYADRFTSVRKSMLHMLRSFHAD
ncbi:MAG TPA: hypothetical protein VFB58_10995 [Chloroflexota bacterium]|nr:hypothetical protein [Chloroflexota bacterium]